MVWKEGWEDVKFDLAAPVEEGIIQPQPFDWYDDDEESTIPKRIQRLQRRRSKEGGQGRKEKNHRRKRETTSLKQVTVHLAQPPSPQRFSSLRHVIRPIITKSNELFLNCSTQHM